MRYGNSMLCGSVEGRDVVVRFGQSARFGCTQKRERPMKSGGREMPRVGRRCLAMLAVVALMASASGIKADGILPNGLADPRVLHVNLNQTPADGQTVSLGSLNYGSSFGLDGAGVKVGIIADSFDTASLFAAPANINILKDDFDTDYGAPVNPTNTGRAMYEVLNAIAPGAQFYFHSAFNNAFSSADPSKRVSTPQSMVAAIDALRAQGVDIIVDATSYRNEPWFQIGGNAAIKKTIAQAVDQAKADGIAYFTPASTDGTWSYEGAFSRNPVPFNVVGYDLHKFDTGSPNAFRQHSMQVTVPFGSTLTVALQWNDEFESLRGINNGGDGDFDLLLFAETLPGIQAISSRMQFTNGDLEDSENMLQDGQTDLDPWELLSFTNNTNLNQQTQTNNFFITVGFDPTQPANPLHNIKLIVSGDGVVLNDPGLTANEWTNTGHSSALGAITVGSFGGDSNLAIDPLNPQVGDPVDPDSGLAGATILFDHNGNPIAQTRYMDSTENPMLAGLDDFDLSHIADLVARGLGTFDGPAAAATYVAGIAALLVEAGFNSGNPLTVDEIYQKLAFYAIDIESPGFDQLSGDGLVDPMLLLTNESENGIPEPATMLLLTLGLASALLPRPRRSGR